MPSLLVDVDEIARCTVPNFMPRMWQPRSVHPMPDMRSYSPKFMHKHRLTPKPYCYLLPVRDEEVASCWVGGKPKVSR